MIWSIQWHYPILYLDNQYLTLCTVCTGVNSHLGIMLVSSNLIKMRTFYGQKRERKIEKEKKISENVVNSRSIFKFCAKHRNLDQYISYR